MSPTTLPIARRSSGLTGHHVLFGFLGFFGVIFAVNGVLLYKAISTHSGLVANEPYRKGLAYNARIAADARQQALGWTEASSVDPQGAISVTVKDKSGAAVSGLKLTAVMGRPTTVRNDITVQLTEAEAGRYTGDSGRLGDGAWILSVEAREASETAQALPVYRMKRRIWLKP